MAGILARPIHRFPPVTGQSATSRFWSCLELTQGSRVFVPLCGKSQDMLWLAQQGHEVIGVELSPVAVAGLFRENGLQPALQRMGRISRSWRVAS